MAKYEQNNIYHLFIYFLILVVESLDVFLKENVTVCIPLDKVNADYVKSSDTLKRWNEKGCLRNCSTALHSWDDNIFSSYFEMRAVPDSELTRFKQVVTNYLANVIRFGFREFIQLKRGSWSLSKNGKI